MVLCGICSTHPTPSNTPINTGSKWWGMGKKNPTKTTTKKPHELLRQADNPAEPEIIIIKTSVDWKGKKKFPKRKATFKKHLYA